MNRNSLSKPRKSANCLHIKNMTSQPAIYFTIFRRRQISLISYLHSKATNSSTSARPHVDSRFDNLTRSYTHKRLSHSYSSLKVTFT